MGRKNKRQPHEGGTEVKKPNRKVQAANIGIYSLRHKIIAPVGSSMDVFQAELGEELAGHYNGKGYTVGSLGVTVAGISEYPETFFRQCRPREKALTSQIISKLLLENYGLGGVPIDLKTEGVDIFSKNQAARWKSLAIVFTKESSSVITQEQAAINDILKKQGYPQLKRYGGIASRPHVSIGTIDTWTVRDTEPATLKRILPSAIPGLLHFSELKEISPRQPDEGPVPLAMPENDAFLAGHYEEDPRYSV